MTGLDLITAALAAGATAGVTGVATSAVEDLYRGLRDRLRGLLADRGRATQALERQETDAQVWASDLGPDLVRVGADRDEQILATARLLLELTRGNPTVDVHDGGQFQSGHNGLRIDNNYGAAAATMTGPITINNGSEALPPARPEAK